MAAFRLASINVCGLKDKVKLHSLITENSWDILCVQKVRWDQGWVEHFKISYPHHLFVSLGSVHSCGVAIIVRASFPSTPTLVFGDQQGRIIVLDFDLPFLFRVINI